MQIGLREAKQQFSRLMKVVRGREANVADRAGKTAGCGQTHLWRRDGIHYSET
jgi:hypothetical protein